MGDGKAAEGDWLPRLIGVKERSMIFKGVKFPAGFGVASVAEHPLPGCEGDVRVLPLCHILVADKPAGHPEAPVLRLKYLEIGIIPFVVPFVVEASGFLMDPVSVREFQ